MTLKIVALVLSALSLGLSVVVMVSQAILLRHEERRKSKGKTSKLN